MRPDTVQHKGDRSGDSNSQDNLNDRLHVLIVDKVGGDGETIKQYLEALEALVVVAEDAQKAIECAQWLKPDVVLLELTLQETNDGLELCRRFKQESQFCPPSVIFISTQMTEYQKACEVGADDFVGKPMNREQLLSKVETQIRFKKLLKQIPGSSGAPSSTNTGSSDSGESTFSSSTRARDLIDHTACCFNRLAFSEYVQHMLDHQTNDADVGAYVQIKLNCLPLVNECCGFEVGDLLIRQAVDRIQKANGEDLFLARILGEQFALVSPRFNQTQLRQLVSRLKEELNSRPFVHEGFHIDLAAQVAVHRIDAGIESIDQLYFMRVGVGESLLEEVNVYESILMSGKPKKELADPSINWAKILLEGIENDRFEVHVQQISCINFMHQVEGQLKFEALVRLQDGNGGLHQPGLFIPAAERLHLVGQIDRTVITKVIQYFAANPADLNHLLSISINLSAFSLQQPGLKEFIADTCEEYGFDPKYLVFELTETQNITSAQQARDVMHSIKELGCRFSLDDFGTGFASFTFMLELPFDIVKIDGSLVRELAEGSLALTMVKAIVHISHSIGASVIAEYVENTKILSQLSVLDIDWGQGYAIHRPEPLVPGLFKRLLSSM